MSSSATAAWAAECIDFEKAAKALGWTGPAERQRLVKWGYRLADRMEQLAFDDSDGALTLEERGAVLELVAGMRRRLQEVR